MDFAKIVLAIAAMLSLGAALAHSSGQEEREVLSAIRVISPRVGDVLSGKGTGGSCSNDGGALVSNQSALSSPGSLRDLTSLITSMKPDYLNMRCDELKRAYSDDLQLVQRIEGANGASSREIEPQLLDSTRQSLDRLKSDIQSNRIPAGMRQRLSAKYPFLAFYVDGTPVDFIPGMAAFKAELLRQIDEGRGKVDHLGEQLRAVNGDASIPELLKATKVRCEPRCPSTMNCSGNLGGFWVPLPE